ncbi:MAG TPA: tRNA uridine(34) 5-carboxymethylaminomethyl modification radical SAM/GNAT enzyme Elp3 [Polyangiales bacterium]
MSSTTSRPPRGPRPFDPEAHRQPLLAVLRDLESLLLQRSVVDTTPLAPAELHRILRRHPRDGSGFFSRSELIAGYRAFAHDEVFAIPQARFVAHLQLRPVRTQSGVTPVTVLTKPFPCPGKCVFCPNDVRMPKSYLSEEPGCQRAEGNGFDPYLQTYQRLSAFRAIGHATDKAELIVLGGTFSFYPEPYQIWFVKRCFDAMNDFGAGVDRTAEASVHRLSVREQETRLDGRELGVGYNKVVSTFLLQKSGPDLLREFEHASFAQLQAAQRENEHSGTRNVGLVLETRPDHVDAAEIVRLRLLGCTKVQVGVQSLSDEVLALNKRGHDVEASRQALHMLRRAGFKLMLHFMPNLLGATAQTDARDFARLFEDPAFMPDELKVYPCSLIESAELMRFYEAGQWRPYTHDELLSVLQVVLAATPRYCRLSRVVRDISSGDIVTGNRLSNFRELAERALAARGERVIDIRAREIRGAAFADHALELSTTRYATSGGEECFIEFLTPDDRLLGFCRLSLPAEAGLLRELSRSALIRELHVYGSSLGLGERQADRAQHTGLGTRLLDEARRQASAAGFADLAVISAVGTRAYYRMRGFVDGALYQHLALTEASRPVI